MRRILVVNPFGIGDALFSMVLVEAIRKAFPDAVIGFVCNERTQEIVRMNTSIDHTFVFNRDSLRRLWRRNPFLLFAKLRALMAMIGEQDFDAVFDLSLGREYSFFLLLAGIPKRIGFDFKGRGIFLTHKKKLEGYEGAHAADTQLELLKLAGIPFDRGHACVPLRISNTAHKEVADFLKTQQIAETDTLIAVAPGGGKSWGKNAHFKQWDAESFAAAVNALERVPHCKAIILGDAAEEPLCRRVAELLKISSAVASGQSLERVCAFLLRSRVFVGNDGGLLHLANALGVKTVSIFGPVDEKVYGPYGSDAYHEVLIQAVSCRPCYRRFYFPPCPYERRCLTELAPEKAAQALVRTLAHL